MKNVHTASVAMSGEAEAVFLPPQLPTSSHRLLWVMLMVSLAAHAALAVAFLHVRSSTRIGTDKNTHVISIALVAAPQKPKPKVETPPPQVTPPEPKKITVEKMPPRPRPTPKNHAVVIQKPAPAEHIVEAAPPAPAVAHADGDAAMSSAALATRAQGRAAYGRLVWKKIAEAKPVGLHRKGSVDVRFGVSSTGTLVSVEVLHSDGDAAFEALARKTLARAAPFPVPPPELTQDDLFFEIPFNFQ